MPISDNSPADDCSCSGRIDSCQLYVELELSIPDECTMADVESGFEAVDFFVFDRTCHCKFSRTGDDDEIYQISQEIGEKCLCRAFSEYDCLPTLEEVHQDRWVVSTHVSNRQVLKGLIDELKDAVERVRLLRIVEIKSGDGDEGESRSITFDLTVLTGTQRETLEVAVTNGYYDDPKDISLEELAAMLDVSKSALSRRLSRAEATLVSQAIRPD